MIYSIFFARLLGMYLVFASIGQLIHQQRYKHLMHEILTNPLYTQLSGSLNIFLGLFVLIPHNIWEARWPVVITALGYLILARGLLRLIMPHLFVRLIKWFLANKGMLLTSWVEFLLGAYLCWAGFTQG